MSQRRSGRNTQQARAVRIVDTFPTPNAIAARAHELFVAGGRRVTKIFEYWQQAERELLDIAARRTLARPQEMRVPHRRRARRDGSR